jgi:ribonuclease Z
MTQIEVTLLGTTACVPTKARSHPAIFLRYQSENEYSYLFDCGEGAQRQMLFAGVNFMRINEIFITHWHADHFAGLLGLFETMNLEGRKETLTIFGPEAERFVEILMELGYSTKDYDIIGHDVNYEGTAVSRILDRDEFEILSIPVKHSIPAVAYAFHEKDRVKIDKEKAKRLGLPSKGLIYRELKSSGSADFKGKKIMLENISMVEKGKKVVYSGDTMPCRNMVKISQDADLLIHDSTRFEENYDGYRHSTLDDVVKLAGEAKVKQVILTHISRRYQDSDELKKMIENIPNFRIAKDMMKITLG